MRRPNPPGNEEAEVKVDNNEGGSNESEFKIDGSMVEIEFNVDELALESEVSTDASRLESAVIVDGSRVVGRFVAESPIVPLSKELKAFTPQNPVNKEDRIAEKLLAPKNLVNKEGCIDESAFPPRNPVNKEDCMDDAVFTPNKPVKKEGCIDEKEPSTEGPKLDSALSAAGSRVERALNTPRFPPGKNPVCERLR